MPDPRALSAHRRAVVSRCLSALAVAGLLWSSSTLHGETSLRVLDFNLHRDLGGTDSNKSSQPALAKVVNYLDPDVWTINELGGNDASFNASFARSDLIRFVEENLTIFGTNPQEGADFFVHIGTIVDGFITNAIVSRYPLLAARTYSDAGNGFNALRGLEMVFVDLPGASDLGVFTAHLKAFNATSDAEKRQAEANVDSANVADWLQGHPSAGAVLTGDWNETEDTGEIANWNAHKIGDPLPNTGESYHPIATMKSAGLVDAAPASITGDRDTISSTSPTSRFDYMLYTPGRLSLTGGMVFDTRQYSTAQLAALNAANGTNFVAGDSMSASDHLPVLAIFQVVPEPCAIALIGLGIICMTSRAPMRRPRDRLRSIE